MQAQAAMVHQDARVLLLVRGWFFLPLSSTVTQIFGRMLSSARSLMLVVLLALASLARADFNATSFTRTTLSLPASPATQGVAVRGSTVFYSDGESLWAYALRTQQASTFGR